MQTNFNFGSTNPVPDFPLLLHLHVMSLISPLLSSATVRVMTMCTQTSEGKMQECTGVSEKARSSSAAKM